MDKVSPAQLISLFDEKGYTLGIFNIVGFRNRFGRSNYFDDFIAIYRQRAGAWETFWYEATTLPGTPSLLKPVNVKGTAILAANQYTDCYKIGFHRGKYEALVQVKPVEVYRDNNRDIFYNQENKEAGLFGINIHRASLGAKIVGVDSAGCQVIRYRKDYEDFMSLCNKHRILYGNKFTYTLVEL